MHLATPPDRLRHPSRRWLVAAVALGAFLVPTQLVAASAGEDPAVTTTTRPADSTGDHPAVTTTTRPAAPLDPSTDAPVAASPNFTG